MVDILPIMVYYNILPITWIYSYCNGILWDNAWDIWDNNG
jgi:hypothetical protein